jgi:RNA polymerase-interacting CarD/CdnL/TRCF family regulator
MSGFSVNKEVIHCREGLATIIDSKEMNGKSYFLVRANRLSGETCYVPVDSANSIIREIMNEKEADKLLRYIKGIEKEFNTNTKQRRDAYKKRLSSGDVKDIAYLYRQLYFYNEIGGDNNTEIKLGPVDLDMLNYATNMLLDELAISYKQPREKVSSFVEKRIKSL